jgi:hypothetical protein
LQPSPFSQPPNLRKSSLHKQRKNAIFSTSLDFAKFIHENLQNDFERGAQRPWEGMKGEGGCKPEGGLEAGAQGKGVGVSKVQKLLGVGVLDDDDVTGA